MIVERGTVVTLDFELRDAQDELIQEHGGKPIVYLQGGQYEVFPKIQMALEGKSVGAEVFLQLEPEDTFGELDPDLIKIDLVENFPEALEVGMQLEELPVGHEQEEEVNAYSETGHVWTVTDIADGKVLLDGNHPLAGVTLRYHFKVVDIRLATEEETEQGAAIESLLSVASYDDVSSLN